MVDDIMVDCTSAALKCPLLSFTALHCAPPLISLNKRGGGLNTNVCRTNKKKCLQRPRTNSFMAAFTQL